MNARSLHERDAVGPITAVPGASPSLPGGALSLLIVGASGSVVVPLPQTGRLVIGRGPDSDIRLDDAKLSRTHAAIVVSDGSVDYVDMGSLNGSFLRDRRLSRDTEAGLQPGDSVALGDTVLVLQRATNFGARPRHIWTHGHFEALLEEECRRAARGGAPFAVVRLRIRPDADATTMKDSAAPTLLAMWLRESDVVARYASNDYEILLLKTTADEADARVELLSKDLTAAGTAFELTVAAYPRDGRTPEALVEQTHRVLHREAKRSDRVSVVATSAIERVRHVVERIAAGAITVLVLGETGVGKEVLARRIHELSPRAKAPLVSINCAALSQSLLESELFGHEKGAFTGALAAKAGLLESAHGGTVFLDEIGEMPLATQAKLLRVLEQREVTRVGAVRPRPVDVRFVSATNRDVEADVAAGRFRQDLFFRLNGVTLILPPLRERVDEIEPLATAFIEETSDGRTMRLSPQSLEILQRYPWPGNIRELRNVIGRAVLLCSGHVITPSHLPVEKMGPVLTSPRSTIRPPPMESFTVADRGSTDITQPAAAPCDERARIVHALAQCAWNQSQAAKTLGISRGTLIKRIEEYGLPRPRKS